jgi:hypothetical protein
MTAWLPHVDSSIVLDGLKSLLLLLSVLIARPLIVRSIARNSGQTMEAKRQQNLLEAPSPEPRITIQLSERGRIVLVLRFPAPDRGRSRIEQAILRRYLSAK